MDVSQLKPGLRVIVTCDKGTLGMLIHEKHLNIRRVGAVGVLEQWVPGHGGDVWTVRQKDGLACYSFDEIELWPEEFDALVTALQSILEHVEDTAAPRSQNQCTLCFTYRKMAREALALTGVAVQQ